MSGCALPTQSAASGKQPIAAQTSTESPSVQIGSGTEGRAHRQFSVAALPTALAAQLPAAGTHPLLPLRYLLEDVGIWKRELRPEHYAEIHRYLAEPEPGTIIQVPAALPDPDRVDHYLCRTANRYPANELHASFAGDAANLACQAVTASGEVKYSFQDAYLYAYRLTFRLSQFEDGVEQVGRLRKVVVEQ